MTYPVISALTAGSIGILMMVLMLRAGFGRVKYSQTIGEGDNNELIKRVRAHGNITENAPMFLIVLAALEMAGGNKDAILALGAAFVVARIIHALALSFSTGATIPRGLGAMTSTFLILGTSVYLIWIVSHMA